MGRLLNLEEAAEYVGLTPDQLKISRQRGLPPGRLGRSVDGHLYFDSDDLLPPPAHKRQPPAAEPGEPIRRDGDWDIFPDGSKVRRAIHVGGGWYLLPGGRKVRGRKAAGLE